MSNKASYSNIREFTESISMSAAYNNGCRPNELTYHLYLKELFNDYSLQLDKDWKKVPFAPEKSTFSSIVIQCHEYANKLMREILHAVDAYKRGNPSEASEIFNVAMNEIFPYLMELRILHCDNNERWDLFEKLCQCSHSHLFRVRRLENSRVSVDEMRHPPFELANKIPPERFSVQGVPCLYLGSTIYVCVQEVGIESSDFETSSMQKLYASRYWWNRKENDTTAFLELFLRPEQFAEFYARLPDRFDSQGLYGEIPIRNFILSYLIVWPLQLACSIPVVKHQKVENVNEHEEYIVPQLLMMWLKCQKNEKDGVFHGICYQSTKIPQNLFNKKPAFFLNYAIPVFTNEKKGFCEKVGKLFDITFPFCIMVNEDCSFDNLRRMEGIIDQEYPLNPDPYFMPREFKSLLDKSGNAIRDNQRE